MLHPPPSSTLFPYTTLFRSVRAGRGADRAGRVRTADAGRVPGAARASLAVRLAEGPAGLAGGATTRSEEHTSELQSRRDLVCRLLLEKKKKKRRKKK